jgi:hypothetical protein
MQQLSSHWMDFRVILYLSIFGKSVETIQVSVLYIQRDATMSSQYFILLQCHSTCFGCKGHPKHVE